MTSPADPPRPPEGALPCPFCRMTLDDDCIEGSQRAGFVRVACAVCGMRGPWLEGRGRAVNGWNSIAALRASAERAERLEKALRGVVEWVGWTFDDTELAFGAQKIRAAARAALEGK